MNNKKTTLVVSLIMVFSFVMAAASLMSVADAQTATSILVFTSNVPNPTMMQLTSQFNPGQTVYIGWTTGNGGTVDISVTDPNGQPVALTLPAGYSTPNDLPTTTSFQVYFTATTAGQYNISVNGDPDQIAVTPLFVTPETMFGTIGLVATVFAALGFFVAIKAKHGKFTKK